MKKKILIVEDGIVEANNLRIIMENAGYVVTGLVDSYERAITSLEKESPDLVLLDIFLAGPRTGIDLARVLKERNIAFIYLSANSNKDTLELAKVTGPYGFLVKCTVFMTFYFIIGVVKNTSRSLSRGMVPPALI